MNDYYLELGSCNNYQDILNIIAKINGEINYCIEISDNVRLIQLRQVLSQIKIVADYIIKKRFEIVMPLLIQERKDMLIDMRDKYKRIYKKLDTLYKLNLGKYRDIDNLPDMNEWIIELISIYREYGYEITMDDFKDIFDEKACDYQRDNYIIYEYMKLIFMHMDDVDHSDFSRLLFQLDEANHIKLSDANPILDIISTAINRFNNKHKKLFGDEFKDINKDAKELNIIEINMNNVYEIRNILGIQIEKLDTRIKEVEEGDYSFVLSSYSDRYINEDELDIDIKIHSFCNMITNNGYSKMDEKTKDEFFKDLYEIMDIIIKLKIFSLLSSEYLEYSKNNGYDELIGEWILINEERNLIIQKINNKKMQIKQEKGKPFAGLNKKKIYGLEYELDRLNKELDSINTRLEECSKKKSTYIITFIKQLVESGKGYNIEGFDNVDKLFGVFDFEMLPLSSNKVNSMELFKKYGIKIPGLDTKKFTNLSVECLNFINNSIFIERRKSKFRRVSLMNDKVFEDIADHKFDHLIDTVSNEHIENIANKKR